MNTSEFVREYAEQYGVAIQAADIWVRTILEYLSECVVNNDEVKLAKFGVFHHGYIPATGYTDFHTGEWKTSKPKMTVKFSMGQQMEAAMKNVPIPDEMRKKSRRKSEIPSRNKKASKGEVSDLGATDEIQPDHQSGEVSSD